MGLLSTPIGQGIKVGSGLLDEAVSGIKQLVKKAEDFLPWDEEVTYLDEATNGVITLAKFPDGRTSVIKLEVPEEFRGKGVAKKLQAQAMNDNPNLTGQVSSKKAATSAYNLGRRPISNPNATLEEVYAAIDDMSSVNMATPDAIKAFNSGASPVRGLLDMDTPSRMARAKEQGFDTDNVYYHGTSDANIDAFNTDVVFVSKSPKVAENEGGFLDDSFDKIIGKDVVDESNAKAKTSVYPVMLRGKIANSKQVKDAIKTLGVGSANDSRVVDYLKAKGFDGMAPSGYETISFDPKNIRSVNAAFDPAKASSSNLLASRPEAAIGGLLALTAMGASEDADAGVVSSGVRIAKEILNLRAQGRANEVTNEMMSYADPQYLFDNTPLPMDTASRLNRAEGGGFDTNVPLYHSGNKEIESINPDFKASFGGEKGAFYTTTNPDVANTYGGDIMQQFYGKTPEDALIVDAYNRGFSELGKETVTSQGALGDVVPQQFDKWSVGHRSIGRPEVIHTDMVSAGYPSDTTIFNRLKDEGFYNRIDPEDEFYDGTPSTVRADQNATNLRSTSARFDPEFSHLSNTLASNPVATTSAGLMANVTGQPSNLSSYMQGNTDAYLTNAERQYLQNKQAFESNFSDDTGWDRADILPFRVNEQTGEVEFATPEMIKGLLSGIYDIGQSKNTKIKDPASLLEFI